MYAPLQFIEQVKNFINVKGAVALSSTLNQNRINWFNAIVDKDRDRTLETVSKLWGAFSDKRISKEDYNRLYKAVCKEIQEYTETTRVPVHDVEDYYHDCLMNIIMHDWSRNKRVYKIDPVLVQDFQDMEIPESVSMDILTKLPCKCFYIEWEGEQKFCKKSVGCFITVGSYNDVVTFSCTNLIPLERLCPITTSFSIKNNDNRPVSTNLSMFRRKYRVECEDGSCTMFYEQAFVKFVFNFLLYLNAANANVEYTERTRKVYRPLKEGQQPTNRIREIEEFGVGYKHSTTVSLSKKRYKYDSNQQYNSNAPKRPYSSNYRSAHWHTYWVNDPEHPGEKKKILNWVEQVFVRGNRADDSVRIHDVKK